MAIPARRFEVKLTCRGICLPWVRSWVRLHPDAFVEAYPRRRVNNLYFDTFEMGSLNDHLNGVGERGKLRLRWYGEGYSAVRGVLELKLRSNRLGWKSYCRIPQTFDLTTISWKDLLGYMRTFAEGEHALALARADRPTLLNSYMREYYESGDREIRLTIDSDQTAYEQLTHTAPNVRFPAHVESRVIVEVKSDPGLARRVSNILSAFPVPVERNSKYVEGMLDSMRFTNRRIR
ncbi:VTC domain-containing protein [Chloroflexota bacterium]